MNTQAAKEALSPTDLISATQITPPSGIVKVRGRVTRLTHHKPSGYVYGDLASLNDESRISFRCPQDAAPSSQNQLAVIEGGLRLKPAYQAPGFNLEISGSCTGSFQLPEVQTVIIPERAAKLPLLELLEKKPLYAIIGSQKGIRDAIQAGATPKWESEQSQSNPPAILERARAFKQEGADAIFFVRGGADSTLELWNSPEFVKDLVELDIPFYTALGHSDFVSLADQCADYSYRTPDHLGQAISQSDESITKQENLLQTIKRLRQSESDTSSELDITRHQLEQQNQSTREKLEAATFERQKIEKRLTGQRNTWIAITIPCAIFIIGILTLNLMKL
jgi:hypothetical protein